MAKAKTATVDVWKKKKWYPIYAPQQFKETFLGETPALEPALLKGRKVEASMLMITGDLKKQGYALTFRINDIKDNKAVTECIKFEIKPYVVRKFVKKNCERVDDSFIAQTADNKYVRVKPLIISLRKISKLVQTQIRKNVSDIIVREFKKKNLEDLYAEIAFSRIQKSIYEKIRKISPVRLVEIRSLEAIEVLKKSKKAREEGAEEVVEEEEEIIEDDGSSEEKQEEETPSEEAESEESEQEQ